MRTTAYTPNDANRQELERARYRFVERPFEDFVDVREMRGVGRVVFTDADGRQFSRVGVDDDVEFFTVDSAGKPHYLRERGKPRPILTSQILSVIRMPPGGKTLPYVPPPLLEDPPSVEQRLRKLEEGAA